MRITIRPGRSVGKIVAEGECPTCLKPITEDFDFNLDAVKDVTFVCSTCPFKLTVTVTVLPAASEPATSFDS